MDRVQVIVVRDEASALRRYQVPRWLVEYGPWTAVVLAILVVVGAVDYVRLRWNAVDVDRLRQQTAQQRSELDSLAGGLASLEDEFARLWEFERKVRVIADLPGAMVEAAVPEDASAGQGGELEEPTSSERDTGAEIPTGEEAATPGGQGGPESLEPPSLPSASMDLDRAVLAGTRDGIRRLALRTATQAMSFEELVEGLEGKRHRLASTPSIWPTEGWVTSGYGYRISPFTGRRAFHAGLDIASDFGTAIVAPARVPWARRW